MARWRISSVLGALLLALAIWMPHGTPAASAAQPTSDAPKLKLAIAGVVHGHVHGFMRRFKDRTNFEVVGAYDPDPELRAAFAKRYGLDDSKVFADLPTLLDKVKPERSPPSPTPTITPPSSKPPPRAASTS